MAPYEQFCGLAKALDIVGDRWTLLIVRELLACGPARYTDLRNGLPGIATNLLASRLRELEKAGVVRREEAPPPVATTLFTLTERGAALRPALLALGEWGVPLLAEAPESDAFCAHWLAFPVELFFRDREPAGPPLAIQIDVGGESVVVEAAAGTLRTRRGRAEKPDAVLSGPPKVVVGAFMGAIPLEAALAQGLVLEGDPAALRRIQPPAPS
jgi:DNA-binding HxlR family transcriptional regulator